MKNKNTTHVNNNIEQHSTITFIYIHTYFHRRSLQKGWVWPSRGKVAVLPHKPTYKAWPLWPVLSWFCLITLIKELLEIEEKCVKIRL